MASVCMGAAERFGWRKEALTTHRLAGGLFRFATMLLALPKSSNEGQEYSVKSVCREWRLRESSAAHEMLYDLWERGRMDTYC